MPVRAGSRLVGATFIATNYRPSLDIIRHYDRKSLENNTIPQLQNYPAIGFVRIQGPFNAQRPADSASRRKIFTCRPSATVAAEAACAQQILTTLARRAYRRPPTAPEITTLMTFFDEGRKGATFEDGIEFALRCILASPQFLVRAEREPAARRAPGRPTASPISSSRRGCRSSCGAAFPDDELITVAAQGRLSQPRVLEQQVRRMLADPRSDALVVELRAAVAVSAQPAVDVARRHLLSELGRRAARRASARVRAVLREHHPRGPQHPRSADRRLHVRQRAAGAALRHPERLRLALPPRDAAAGDGLPPRPARQGQLPRGDLDAELPQLAGQARRVGAREHPRARRRRSRRRTCRRSRTPRATTARR